MTHGNNNVRIVSPRMKVMEIPGIKQFRRNFDAFRRNVNHNGTRSALVLFALVTSYVMIPGVADAFEFKFMLVWA